MASGFNSPNILFLNTYDSLDRKYMAEIVPKLIKSGYERYAELYAGGFAMPLVVASCGIKPENIYCYDISLYACILGYLFSGQNLSELKVKRDGKDVVLNGKTVYENAAILLYEQAKARIENCANNYYMELLLENMNNKDFEKLQKEVDTSADLIGIAPMKTFDEFVDAIRKVSRAKNIKSIGTTIVYLTKIALQEIEKYGKTE